MKSLVKKSISSSIYFRLISNNYFFNQEINNTNKNSTYKNFSFSTNNLFKNHINNTLNYGSMIKNISLKNTFMNNFYYTSLFQLRTIAKKVRDYETKYKAKKVKNRSSLMRRLKIVGPSFDRHFLFRRIGYYHKRVKKSGRNKRKRTLKLLSMSNKKFVKRNLPYYKNKKYKESRGY